MPATMNFGVVGLGMGVHHCKAIQDAGGAALAAVCDVDQERLNKTVEEYGCKGYARYEDLLADPGVDAVNICTESGKHAAMGIQACEAGKHLIVEKPVDVTPAKIKSLEDAVAKAGVRAGCIFQTRLEPCYKELKRAIEHGHLGRLLGAHAALPWFRAQSYYEGPHGAWKGSWDLDGGGSLMNQGIHTVDILQWLAGPVESVCGFYDVMDHDIEAEDMTVAALRFENGALGTLFTTTCSKPEGAQRLYLHGTEGSFCYHGGRLEHYAMGPEDERERMMGAFGPGQGGGGDAASADPMAVDADGHTLIIEDFVLAVKEGRDPLIPIASAKHAVEIACAVFEACRRGATVHIKDIRA